MRKLVHGAKLFTRYNVPVETPQVELGGVRHYATGSAVALPIIARGKRYRLWNLSARCIGASVSGAGPSVPTTFAVTAPIDAVEVHAHALGAVVGVFGTMGLDVDFKGWAHPFTAAVVLAVLVPSRAHNGLLFETRSCDLIESCSPRSA